MFHLLLIVHVSYQKSNGGYWKCDLNAWWMIDILDVEGRILDVVDGFTPGISGIMNQVRILMIFFIN